MDIEVLDKAGIVWTAGVGLWTLLVVVPATIRLWSRTIRRRGGRRYFALITFRRWKRVRFSSTAVLLLDDAGEYFVHWTENDGDGYWGPVGGVLKSYPSAEDTLRHLQVEPEVVASARKDRQYDLRVKMPAGALRRFLGWYDLGVGRETVEMALLREMWEELEDVGMPVDDWLDGFRLPLSKVYEAPPVIYRDLRDPDLWHYRLFVALKLEDPSRHRVLQSARERSDDTRMSFVDRRAIDARRHLGRPVGNHSDVLLCRPRRM